ncbi:hypothetical protein E1281_14530 [Actinomadura sp. KC345]|uniref:hypothetical protein n=1 Tax=Actinomadura sp. KC345 TaxID=2530371 RepID=UPI00104E8499|nr:hypothetical protein [Actinomadura sp. KC345]TDC55032.1 hypothetical protein E1281_14530 [Actinomadura sp. KC345]
MYQLFMTWLLVFVGLSGFVGCHVFLVLFAHELAERLLTSGRTPSARAAAQPVATAALAGAGTTLLGMALEIGAPSSLWISAAGTLAGAVSSTVVLLRRGRRGNSARTRLARYADPRYRAADSGGRARALAGVRRIERTGTRLAGRADGLTVRRWAARPARGDLVAVTLWLYTSGVMAVAFMLVFRGVTWPSPTEAAAMTVLVLSCLTGPAWMLLRHDNRRRRLRRIGTELAEDARRASASLTAR